MKDMESIYREIDQRRAMQFEADLVYQEAPEDAVWPKLGRSIVPHGERWVDHARRQDAKSGKPLIPSRQLVERLGLKGIE